jgi:serine/threonine protein kinase
MRPPRVDAAPLRPKVNDKLRLFGKDLFFQEHPKAKGQVYSAGGAKARVYRLVNDGGEVFGLKVFKKAYRTRATILSAAWLKSSESLPGMKAARRQVVGSRDESVRRYPELEFAVLMPWIIGDTWFDVLIRAQRDRLYLSPDAAMHFSTQLLSVVAGLEERGIAHTDLAPGNVVLDPKTGSVELLDLEEMFASGAQKPPKLPVGTTGYRHPTGDVGGTCWCAEGDRYASAILAAEILALSNPALSWRASDEGFFKAHRLSEEGRDRFGEAKRFLEELAPTFAGRFEEAWSSATLLNCPTAGVLKAALPPASHRDGFGTVPVYRYRTLPFTWVPFDFKSEKPTTRTRVRQIYLRSRKLTRSKRRLLAIGVLVLVLMCAIAVGVLWYIRQRI